ncbi:MAG TPA: aldolase/citrate lyase family protein [Vicinamibacterales bacterium]|nr:aldolase/citrate lyase family protein [Vicinamibacterales bacterium]
MTRASGFRTRLLARQTLVGTFLKTPTGHGVEIVGDAGFDFVVIDQEHAPFDRSSTDVALAIACARGLPVLVRVAGPDTILSVLDGGATGILMPHVASVEQARALVAACRYRAGRGFATSTRAGRYTATPIWDHIDREDAETVVIAQIEDVAALPQVDAIAAVEGIDALFAGRGDLTAAFGDRTSDRSVRDASDRIAAAARQSGKALSVYTGDPGEAAYLSGLGASLFVVSSDQGFLRQGALAALGALKKALGAASSER